MNLIEIDERTVNLIEKLTIIWEASVKETHLFLSNDEIAEIKKFVPQALHNIHHVIIAENEEDETVAFMGVENQKLEMLFISPNERGKGLGSKMIHHGIEHYDIHEVAVNEQNPQAKGFYEHMGFSVYKRSLLDEQGNPYPLLYMKLKLKRGKKNGTQKNK